MACPVSTSGYVALWVGQCGQCRVAAPLGCVWDDMLVKMVGGWAEQGVLCVGAEEALLTVLVLLQEGSSRPHCSG